jgi:hypothetical protein
MFGLNTRKPAQETPADLPVTVRKNWQWNGTETLPATEILQELRYRVNEFTDENSLDWGVVEYHLPIGSSTVKLQVALTPEQDIEFSIGGTTTFDQKQAVRFLEALRTQELVF